MIRRYIAEFIGTFGIVFAPVALSASSSFHSTDASLFAVAVVSGLAVLAMIFALGPVSAAHFNPAVTLGFAVAKRFPWKFVLPYWISQLLGGVTAATFSLVLFGKAGGAHIPADSTALLRNVGTESILTFFLMLVIIAVATDKRVSSTTPAVAIGMTVVFAILVGGPVTGASMNPARSLGPAFFVPGALAHIWLYVVAPCLGAVSAALVYEAIRLAPSASKGAPNELLEAVD